MSWLESLLLGLVQGLTEFLPVSSSGHIELSKALLGTEIPDDIFFSLLLHFATVLSILIVFRKDIADILKNLFSGKQETIQYVIFLLLSAVPVGVVGILFEDQLAAFFDGQILYVGLFLLVTAALLFFSRFEPKTKRKVSLFAALAIGLAQAIAIMPGISRSGATISTALLLGVDRNEASRFSFLMVLLPIIGATLLKGKDVLEAGSGATLFEPVYLVGFIAAFVSGLLACTWMIRLVNKGGLIYFSIYCLAVGLIAIFTGM